MKHEFPRRLERFVAFLHDLFGADGMRRMHPTCPESGRENGPRTGEALDRIERAVHSGAADISFPATPGLTEALIDAVAAGHGERVRSIMEAGGLAEPMEPLWHATRAELGEQLDPLPAEIMDTVGEIRRRFAERRT